MAKDQVRFGERAAKYQTRFSESCFSPLVVQTQAAWAEDAEDFQLTNPEARPSFRISFSEDQEAVYKELIAWLKRRGDKLLTIGGFAGSGKSSMISVLAGDLYHKKVVFCALTGKAAGVLRKKIRDAGVKGPNHEVMTLHSLLYQSYTHECTDVCKKDGKKCDKSGMLCWSTKPGGLADLDLIVIDEASMVSDQILKDLMAYGPKKVLAVGDHGQLPPVGGAASLMESPNLRLEKIHRQAAGNPILELSQMIREYGALPQTLPGGKDGRVQYVKHQEFEALMRQVYSEREIKDVATLCWTNRARTRLNEVCRKIVLKEEYDPSSPVDGDQIICLRNAYRTAFNGMRGVLEDVAPAVGSEHHYRATALFTEDNIRFRGDACRHLFGLEKGLSSLIDLEGYGMKVKTWEDFGMQLDYGYVLTVHKAQGSQFDTVAYVREKPAQASADHYKRHLYTGITRASDRLFIVI
jgi:exodeoxyribonuclease V